MIDTILYNQILKPVKIGGEEWEPAHPEPEVRFTGITTFNDHLTLGIRSGIKVWIKIAIALFAIVLISAIGYTLRFPRYFSLPFLIFSLVLAIAVLLLVGLILFFIYHYGRYSLFQNATLTVKRI
ncbi:MAG TPA: hypothetical protein VN370_00405 [Desulfitobacteriaceae bacterium]|nr:hypothetical protein [Desulfitobacteriaceae bacterium]